MLQTSSLLQVLVLYSLMFFIMKMEVSEIVRALLLSIVYTILASIV